MIRNRDHSCVVVACSILFGASLGCTDPTSVDDVIEPDHDHDHEDEPEPAGQPGVWGTARRLHELPGSSQYPVLRVDGSGRALALWQQTYSVAPYNRLWSSRRMGTQWETPVLVAADGNLGSELEVAGDVANAQLVWLQSQGVERRIVATEVDANGSWSPITTLRSSTWEQGPILSPQLAVDASHAAVVWAFEDPSTRRFVIEGRIRQGAGSWSPVPPIATGVLLASYSRPLYDLAFDDAGALVVTWVEQQPDRAEVWARRGNPVQGSLSIAWEPARKVTTLPKDQNTYPARELWTGTHAGRSFAAWLTEEPDGTMTIGSSHLRPDGAWDAEQGTSQLRSSHYAAPRFAAGAAGHKVVVWREPLAESSRMVARTYDPDTGWEDSTVIADALKAPYLGCIDVDAHYFDVAIDSTGNAIALWEERLDQQDPQDHGPSPMGIWSSQFVTGMGWQPPIRIDGGGPRSGVPHAALIAGNLGVALFVSQAEDGRTALAVNELAPAPVP